MWSRSERTNNILFLVHNIYTFLCSFPHITQSLETTTTQNLQLSYFWSCKVMLLPWILIMCMHIQTNAHFIMSVARSSSHMPAFIYLVRQSVIGAHLSNFSPRMQRCYTIYLSQATVPNLYAQANAYKGDKMIMLFIKRRR